MANISNAINMSFRVDKNLKKQADELFKNLGMNTSVALNMFLTQSVREQNIPFIPSMEVPNARLISAMEEVEAIENEKIDAKNRDHQLINNLRFQNCRECHIEQNWLLVYKKDNSNLILFLIETGIHSDLF